ncbi:peptidyl-prolyl cis-trans isomerase [Rhodohalobacter mucosus]|uniref:PpiC domain-containing protein n=1 Tax=Rhodohalobacter mucosus TaxID=2079485 RepID=A0A316TWI4_9BACT|nr:peptidyl-prolyl cis-trans isomerase [Rhodohalobacter mucosus]PWN07595.1 hypothetical protein DDZ15_04885 [Rhodohalobacter mucosus]
MHHIRYTLLFTVLFLLAQCTPTYQSDNSPVLASVGNQSLTINEALSQIPGSVMNEDSVQAVQSFIDQWIEKQVAVRQAERMGLQNSASVREKMERLRRQILEEALREQLLLQNLDEVEVTRDEAQNYYQAHKDQFILSERYVRFRHITTRTRTDADNANRDLMRGDEWEDILERYSVNPERQLRESNQFWPISMAAETIPMLNRYLNVIGLTERSPIHYFGGEYHLVQLMEERPAGEAPDLEWLIPQIEEWLRLEKARRITNSYIRNLYLEANSNNEIRVANVNEIESMLRSGN